VNLDHNSHEVRLQNAYLRTDSSLRRARFAALGTLVLALAAPAYGEAATAYWPMAKLMRRIDDVRVRVGTRVVRIHSETTLCSGEGRPIRRRGVRMWSRFWCTYTTFTKQGVDRDLEFRVDIVSTRRFVIRDVHWVVASR
jgi:hypothetical protein